MQQKNLHMSCNKASHRVELGKPAELSTTHTYSLKAENITVVFPTNLPVLRCQAVLWSHSWIPMSCIPALVDQHTQCESFCLVNEPMCMFKKTGLMRPLSHEEPDSHKSQYSMKASFVILSKTELFKIMVKYAITCI